MKILEVGEFDFAALHFKNAHSGTDVRYIIDNLEDFLPKEDGDPYEQWELSVVEVDGVVDPNFVEFAKSHIDYERSKDKMWYTEYETV